MKAKYEFCAKQIDSLPLTMQFTADLPEWRKINECLKELEDWNHPAAPDTRDLRPLHDCIRNLIKAIDDATGRGYSTRGYSYEAHQDAPAPEVVT